MRGNVDSLSGRVGQERALSESAIGNADRHLKDVHMEVARLAAEKEDLASRVGRGADAERLRAQNDELAAALKAAERKANATASRLQGLQEKVEEQRMREQDLLRELRELKKLASGKTPAGGAGSTAAGGGGGGRGGGAGAAGGDAEKDAKCRRKFGKDAVYDGKGGCKCRPGYIVKNKVCPSSCEES